MKITFSVRFLGCILAVSVLLSCIVLPGITSYAAGTEEILSAAEEYVVSARNTVTASGLLDAVKKVNSAVKLDDDNDFFIKHAVPAVKDDDTVSGYRLDISGSNGAVAAIFSVGGERIGFSASFPHETEIIHIKEYAVAGEGDGFIYNQSGNIRYVIGYTGTADKIIFPKDSAVTMASASLQTETAAFDNVKVVVIDTDDTTVAGTGIRLQGEAFRGWKNLTALQFGDNAHPRLLFDNISGKYGDGCIPYIFADCSNLKYAKLPETVVSAAWLYPVPTGIFQNCIRLENVNIPTHDYNGNRPIATLAFAGTAVRDIFLPKYVINGTNTFYGPTYSGGTRNIIEYNTAMTFCHAAALAAAQAENFANIADFDTESAASDIISAVKGSKDADIFKSDITADWNDTFAQTDFYNMGILTLTYGNDSIPVTVKSGSKTLDSLDVGYMLTPSFDPTVLEYSVKLPTGSTSLEIETVAVQGATLGEIRGNSGFSYDKENIVEIPVTSVSGKEIIYKINVELSTPDTLVKSIKSAAQKYVTQYKNASDAQGLLAAVQVAVPNATLDAENDFFIKHAVPGVTDDDVTSGYKLDISGSNGAVAATFVVNSNRIGITVAFENDLQTLHINEVAIAGKSDGFIYSQSDNIKYVIGYTGTADKIVFPKDIAVTMAEKKMQTETAANGKVKYVVIDTDDTTSAGTNIRLQSEAFSGWRNLVAVQFGNNAHPRLLFDNISGKYSDGCIPYIFADCPNLKYAKLPEKVVSASWLYPVPTGMFSNCSKLENVSLPAHDFAGNRPLAAASFSGTAVRDFFLPLNLIPNASVSSIFENPTYSGGTRNVITYTTPMTFSRAAALAAAKASEVEFTEETDADEITKQIKSAVSGSMDSESFRNSLIYHWNGTYSETETSVSGVLTLTDANGDSYEIDFARDKDSALLALDVGYQLSPEFSGDVTEYSVLVPNSVTALGIAPKTVPGAKVISIKGNKDFVVGEKKTVVIKVQTISGKNVEYSIDVTRKKLLDVEDAADVIREAALKYPATNDSAEAELLSCLEKSVEGNGLDLALSDMYKYEAISGAKDNYGILVPGYRGYITAEVTVSTKEKAETIGVKFIIEPTFEEYYFTADEVSKPEDFNLSPDGKTLWWYEGDAKKIVIPEGVEYIDTGWNGSDNPAGGIVLILPNTLKELPGMMCYGMRRLEVVYMGDLITTLPNSTFSKCFFLKYVRLSNNIKNVGAYAFFATPSLYQLHIPQKMETADAYAFCGSLIREMTLPATLKEITGLFVYAYATTRAADGFSKGGLFGTTELPLEEAPLVQQTIDKVRFKKVHRNVTVLGNDTTLTSTGAFAVSWKNADGWSPAAPVIVRAAQGSATAQGFVDQEKGIDGTDTYYGDYSLTTKLTLDMTLAEAAARAQYLTDNLYFTNDTTADSIISDIKAAFVSKNVSRVEWQDQLDFTKATAASLGSAMGTVRLYDSAGTYFDVTVNKKVYIPLPEKTISDGVEDGKSDDDGVLVEAYPVYVNNYANVVFVDSYNYVFKVSKAITIQSFLANLGFSDGYYLSFFDKDGKLIPDTDYGTYMLTSSTTASLYNKWGDLYDAFSIEIYSDGVINDMSSAEDTVNNSGPETKRVRKLTNIRKWVPDEINWWLIGALIAAGVVGAGGLTVLIIILVRKREKIKS